MPRDGQSTRERIMNEAQRLIFDQGYAGTSVDAILGKAGVTKGAFFYHFKSKHELAQALIARFAEQDAGLLDDVLGYAQKLSADPAQQVILFVGMLLEKFEGIKETYPGCLYASYTYEMQLFDDGTMDVIRDGLLNWRETIKAVIDRAIERTPPVVSVDASSLADALLVILEGAFVMSKALNEPELVAEQLRHFRTYLQILFKQPVS